MIGVIKKTKAFWAGRKGVMHLAAAMGLYKIDEETGSYK